MPPIKTALKNKHKTTMKGTIKVKSIDGKKLAVSATVNNVKLIKRTVIGDSSMIEVDFRSPADLFETGRLIDHVTGNELDVVEQPVAEKADRTDVKAKK